MTDIEAPENGDRLPKAMDEDDLDLICTAIRLDYEKKLSKGECRAGEMIWLIFLFRFAFYTGMRASELARLRWHHIDIEKRLIFILIQKNGKEQTIPLTRRAAEVLLEVSRREPIDYVFASPRSTTTNRSVQSFVWYVSAAFRTARKLAGIDRSISFHSLRHGFCTRLAAAGKNVAVIRQAARHSNVQMTMHYIDLANELLRSELDEVFA